jgi:hypothetical protein
VIAALVLALVPAAGIRPAHAQEPPPAAEVQRVRLHDGSVLIGTVVEQTADRVVVVTTAGSRVEIPRAQVASIVTVTRGPGGEFWMEDVNATRLFFGPTGRSLGGGEGYLSVFQLFFPFAAYGITDWLTVAAGTAVFPEVMFQLFYIAPKVRVASTPGFEAGVGVLALFLPRETRESAGIAYGVGSVGTPDRGLTFGAGWGFAGGDVANRPALLIGGELRSGRMTKLLTENYLILTDTETVGILTGGIRFFGERLSADAGLGMGVEDGRAFCCLPVVNFVYNFGSSP